MEKRKWYWKRRSSEKSPGETECSGLVSSHSERYSDDQETSKASSNHDVQSPEVASRAAASGKKVNEGVKCLTQKLSAALLNVSAKDGLVQQHAKVAEEAVAGWEKAENEVEVLKQQLDAAAQQKLVLEDRVSHLDGALKECVRELRQAREEQKQKIHEAVVNKTQEWESTKRELDSRLLELHTEAKAAKTGPPVKPNVYHRLEALEKENSSLKLELLSQSKELEIRTIERDLSTEAAETASKQHLESIKRVAKVEAECRRLKAMGHNRPFSVDDYKSTPASSLYAESDGQSDKREHINVVDIDAHKISSLGVTEWKTSCSSSWASVLIAELDQFKNEKAAPRSLSSSSIKMDLMDDFLEMEQLASLPENKSPSHCLEPQSPPKAELLESSVQRTAELERELAEIEAEKAELELALSKSRTCADASEIQLKEAEMKLEELQRELGLANELKQSIELELTGTKAEARTMSMKIDSLEAEVDKKQALTAEIAVKCRELENELLGKNKEAELPQNAIPNGEPKVKQEDVAIAVGKLAECQKTIESLGKQLKSLVTLEDFLLDTSILPEFSRGGSLTAKAGHKLLRSQSRDSGSLRTTNETSAPLNDNAMFSGSTSSSASSSVTMDHISSENSCNGFGKLFSHSRNAIQDD